MDYQRNVSAQGLGRTIYVLTGVMVYVFIARFLGPEILGVYAYGVTVITVATSFADLGTTAILARELVQKSEHKQEVVANYVLLRMMLAMIVGLFLAAFSFLAAPSEIKGPLILAAGLLPLISARFFDPIFQVQNRPWQAFHLAVISSLIWMVSTYVGATWSDSPLFWTVIAHAISGAAYGAIGLAMTWFLIKPRLKLVRRNTLREIAQTAAPFAIGSIFGTLGTRVDVFLLTGMRDTTEVGLYNAAFRFLDLGMAVIITVTGPLLPIFSKLAGTADRQEFIQVFHSLAAFIATGCLLLAMAAPIISPLIIDVFYGASFEPATEILDLLAWRFFLAFMNILFLGLLMSLGTIKFVAWNSAIGLAVNVGLNLILIPQFGGIGAALSGVASEASQVIVEVFVLLRIGAGGFLSPRLWLTLVVAVGAAAGIVHLPTELPPGWVLTAATAIFFLIVRLAGKFPENPLPRLAMVKSLPG